MASEKRMVALAIGIANAIPKAYLRSAISGANAFNSWASELGYEANLLTDEDENPVTVDRLKTMLESILDRGPPPKLKPPIHRLVIYFAGHGLIREAGEGLWLLSDWKKELRAVVVNGLRHRLYRYGVKQISIFSDACRSLPPNIDAAELTPLPVLGNGPEERIEPEFDSFIATQDGKITITVPGSSEEEDICLFSGVLMEGLWGVKKAAFSKVQGRSNIVTSISLGSFLKAETGKIAKQYKATVIPSFSSSFPEDDNIYFIADGTKSVPKLPDWPPPQTEQSLPASAALLRPENFPEPSKMNYLLTSSVELEGLGARAERRKKKQRRSRAIVPSLLSRVQQQERPESFETGAGFAVEGGNVKALWSRDHVIAKVRQRDNWWSVGSRTRLELTAAEPILIEFSDGVFAAVTAFPKFITAVMREKRGVTALVYRESYAPSYVAVGTEEAIAAMESGTLHANSAIDLAVKIRPYKHADPVLGVISAYLYDAIGDLNSVRSLAYYYVKNGQPIPYDIALIANLAYQTDGAQLRANVPMVSKRKPRTEVEANQEWTYSGSPSVSGEVAGFWPWMRQGWTLLEETTDEGNQIVPDLTPIARYLRPSRFTSLSEEGGLRLAELFKLKRRMK